MMFDIFLFLIYLTNFNMFLNIYNGQTTEPISDHSGSKFPELNTMLVSKNGMKIAPFPNFQQI